MFRSRVKLFHIASPSMRRSLVLSTLTKGGHPVNISNYSAEERLEVYVPLTAIHHGSAGHAAIAENGSDIVVYVADQPVVILKDFNDLAKVDLHFIAKTYADDSALYDGRTMVAAEDATVIEDCSKVIVVNQFDLHTDKLEIGEGRGFQLEHAQDCEGTIVVVDGEPIFLLPGILPAQMAAAVVQTESINELRA